MKDQQHREIDFVIKERVDVSQLIQVCYDIDNPKTKERELRSLVGAAKELDCSYLLVITWDYEDVEEFKGNNIRFMPLFQSQSEKKDRARETRHQKRQGHFLKLPHFSSLHYQYFVKYVVFT